MGFQRRITLVKQRDVHISGGFDLSWRREVQARMRYAREQCLKGTSLTMLDISGAAQIDAMTILSWEKSNLTRPTYRQMERLAYVYGVSDWWLWAIIEKGGPDDKEFKYEDR